MEEEQFGTLLATEDGTIDLVSIGLVEYNSWRE
jgi:hypothetical protein